MRHDQRGLAVLPFRLFFFALRVGRRLGFRLDRCQSCKLPLRLDLPDSPADGGFQLVRIHGFQQIVAGSQMHCFVGILKQAVRRHKDDPAAGPLGQDRPRRIQAAHARHFDVHQDQLRPPEHRSVGGFPAILGKFQHHFMLKAVAHHIGQSLPLQLFIIRDQQANHSSKSSSTGSTKGRYRLTAVPHPSWERISNRQRLSSSFKRAATL